MIRHGWTLAVLLAACSAGAQNLPSGTHSADDLSREDSINARIRNAESALEKQDYKTAEVALKQLAAEKPKDAQVLYDLGFSQERNGEDEAAANSYLAADVADEQAIEPRIALGLMHARQGKLSDARAELLAATAIESGAPELRARAYRVLAQIDADAKPSDASTELLDAIKLTGETVEDIVLTAEMADHAKDYGDAEAAYRRALVIAPENIEATVGLGSALKHENQLAEAEDILRHAHEEHLEDDRITAELAATYASENKASEAIPLVEAMLTADHVDTNDSVKRLLARLYSIAGRQADAEATYRQLLHKQPQDPHLLDDLGSVLVKELKYVEAEKLFGQAVILRPEFHDDSAWGDAAFHLAFAAANNKKPQVTLQALAARATVLPNSPASLFLEAKAHDDLHQKKEAERVYKAFLALSAGSLPNEEFEARHRLLALQNEK